jgi:hypothetical protein
VELIQLSLGQGVRLEVSDGDWYIYTYEAGALAVETGEDGRCSANEGNPSEAG